MSLPNNMANTPKCMISLQQKLYLKFHDLSLSTAFTHLSGTSFRLAFR